MMRVSPDTARFDNAVRQALDNQTEHRYALLSCRSRATGSRKSGPVVTTNVFVCWCVTNAEEGSM